MRSSFEAAQDRAYEATFLTFRASFTLLPLKFKVKN